MSQSYSIPPPEREIGSPDLEHELHDGPTGPFFVINCEHIGERIFTKPSPSHEPSRGEIIELSKSPEDIGSVVLSLAARLKLLPENKTELDDIETLIRAEQKMVEQLPWESRSGHYDPEEANTLRQKTKILEEQHFLREALRLRLENPTERNLRVEMLARKLVLREVEYVRLDAVQYALWHLTTSRPKNQS